MNQHEWRFRDKLSPERVRIHLTQSALFLLAYELLKIGVVQNARTEFYGKSKYRREVLGLHRDPFRASRLWLTKLGVFSAADVEVVEAIRRQRNKITHELPNLLIDPGASIDFHLLIEAHRLIAKVGRFWARLDIEATGGARAAQVTDEDILPGALLLMNHVLSILTRGES